MKELINKQQADELLQLAINDCYSWEDFEWDRHNFEAIAGNLEKVQKFLKEQE